MDKICSRCQELKNKDGFYKCKNGRLERSSICKNCRNKEHGEYAKQNKEKINKLQNKHSKIYYSKNKEKCKELRAKWRQSNLEYCKVYQKEYYKKKKLLVNPSSVSTKTPSPLIHQLPFHEYIPFE